MNASRPSLLQRLQQTSEQAAWERFVDLFSSPLFLWALRAGLQGPEAADLVRGTFSLVGRKLPEYRAGSPGGFRTWLRDLAHAQRRELIQKRPAGGQAPAAVPAAADAVWGAEYLPTILGPAIEALQAEFSPAERKACWSMTIEGRPVADVARELNLHPAAVYAAEARVLRGLRQELDGLLD